MTQHTQPIQQIQMKKLRRRIEDYLRKCEDIKLIKVAEFLEIHVQKDLKKIK